MLKISPPIAPRVEGADTGHCASTPWTVYSSISSIMYLLWSYASGWVTVTYDKPNSLH